MSLETIYHCIYVQLVDELNSLLQVQETDVLGDAGYQGADKRPDAKASHKWHMAMRPRKRKKLDNDNSLEMR